MTGVRMKILHQDKCGVRPRRSKGDTSRMFAKAYRDYLKKHKLKKGVPL